MKNKKAIYSVIAILIVVVVGLSIAYAALSTTLNIQFGTVTQNQLTWVVAFKSESSITGTASGSSDSTGRSCGTASASGASVSVNETHLSKPGDKCVWKTTVQNTGGINAKLTTINATAPSGITCTIASAKNTMTCGNIKYSLGTNNTCSTLLTVPKEIAKTSGAYDVYVCAEYVGDSVNSSAVTQSGAKFTLKHDQN